MAQKAAKDYGITVVGATGAVGREFLRILGEREIPVRELRVVGSERSIGKPVEFRDKEVRVQKLSPAVFEGSEIAFFTAGAEISREFGPIAARAGAVVVDNTSAFRLDKDVPLVVPEVNREVLDHLPERGIISVPNCAAIQMVVALAPLHRKARIKRIVMSSYQSTSGAGKKAMDELSKQVSDLYCYREPETKVFPHRIAFNVIPQIGPAQEDGSTGEEAKIVAETKKIFGDESIGVSATAVRVPTFHSHAESINIEMEKPLSASEAREILGKAEGVRVIDDLKDSIYPMPVDVAGTNDVFVGRIRKDPSRENCVNLWVVADNLRKGAALNGIQIIESLIDKKLI